MLRVKVISHFPDWSNELMDEFPDKLQPQCVCGSYEYSQIKKVQIGDLLEVTHYDKITDSKETFIALCSNMTTRRRTTSYSRRRNYNYSYARILFRLTDEGVQKYKEHYIQHNI